MIDLQRQLRCFEHYCFMVGNLANGVFSVVVFGWRCADNNPTHNFPSVKMQQYMLEKIGE